MESARSSGHLSVQSIFPQPPEVSHMSRRWLVVSTAAAMAFAVFPMTRVTAAPSRAAQTLDALNLKLATRAATYRVAQMEYITSRDSGQFGSTVFAKDIGDRQLEFHFVP